MNIKYILMVAITVTATKVSFAQYSQDAIRFSTSQYGATSRIKAIGGAGQAVGGDLSSINGNPAGLGFFTRSELNFTPEIDGSNIKSGYLGQAGKASNTSGNLNNASVVFYSKLNTPKGADKTKGWLSLNIGLSYARTNNFYNNVSYSGSGTDNNKSNSIADWYAQLANNSNYIDDENYLVLPEGSVESVAYNHYLIDSVSSNGQYANFKANTATNPMQANSIITTGGQSEYAVSIGANYSNKFYLGLGVGIVNVRYNTTETFTENGRQYIHFNNSNYTSTYMRDQVTKGTGVNMRLGFIYKPNNVLRIGATVNTPTWYNIDDNTFEGISTQYADPSAPVVDDGGQNYGLTYQFRTPWKISGGLALFAGKYGFVSADIDYLDYSGTKLMDNDSFDSSFDNADIRNTYKSAVNLRLGAEARLTSNVFLRGGYSIYGNTQKYGGSDIKSVTGGLGYRFGDYYIDAAFVHLTSSQTVYPYVLDSSSEFDSPAAALNYSNNNVFVTFGLRF